MVDLGSRVRGRWEEARVWNLGAADLERESKERQKRRGKFCAFIRGGGVGELRARGTEGPWMRGEVCRIHRRFPWEVSN